MRSGASGRPSRSCSSLSARARLLWSAARRSRWRVNSSLALRVTVSSSARLSPRCGTRICDLRARAASASHSSYSVEVVGLDGHEHLLGHARAAARRRTAPRGCGRRARRASRSSTLSRMKPLRPTTRPLRTKNTCTAASSSSSAMPMTSRSSLRSATICCFSMALRTAASRSRRRAARSNSSSSAASRISRLEPLDDRRRCRRRGSRAAPRRAASYAALSISPTHGPAALLDVEQQARPAEPLVLVELVVAARADREACAAAGRASRGWRRRGRRARSSGRPCACGPASTIARGHSSSRVTARNG